MPSRAAIAGFSKSILVESNLEGFPNSLLQLPQILRHAAKLSDFYQQPKVPYHDSTTLMTPAPRISCFFVALYAFLIHYLVFPMTIAN